MKQDFSQGDFMNRISLSYTIMTALISLSVCSAQTYKWNNTGNLPSGYTHKTYYSTLMNTDIGYVIYLPPDYNNSTDRYPVVYSLHGMGGNENGNCQTYSSVMQSSITGNVFPPVIVVFVNGRGNTFYSDSKDGSVKCESSIINELIPHIDTTYRTKADRSQRAIEGISMGGFGALMLGFKHPDMFGSIGTYDAALVNWDTLSQQTFDRSIPNQIFGNDRNYFNENSYPFTFAIKNAATIKSLGIKVRITTGNNDLQMGPLYYYNLAMRDTLNKLGIPLTFNVTPGGSHGQSFTSANVKEYMIFHTTNFKDAITQTLQPVITKSNNNSILAPVTFSSMNVSNFVIPSQWKQHSVKKIQVFNLCGRAIGNVSLQEIDRIDGSAMGRQFGSGVFTLKAVR
jgi:enterochelin esterase-like enzyme